MNVFLCVLYGLPFIVDWIIKILIDFLLNFFYLTRKSHLLCLLSPLLPCRANSNFTSNTKAMAHHNCISNNISTCFHSTSICKLHIMHLSHGQNKVHQNKYPNIFPKLQHFDTSSSNLSFPVYLIKFHNWGLKSPKPAKHTPRHSSGLSVFIAFLLLLLFLVILWVLIIDAFSNKIWQL